MVRKDGDLWLCEECGLKYGDKDMAKRCEEWCSSHRTCNLEIIRHAVGGG